MLAANKKRLLSSGRNSSDGPRFYTRKQGSSLPCVGSTPEPPEQSEVRRQLEEAHAGIGAQTRVGRVHCEEAPLPSAEPQLRRLDFRKAGCDAGTLISNASYHLAVVASDVLLDSEISEKSSSMEHGRFFPAPFGRTLNHASSDLTCWNNFSYLVCAQAGACEWVFAWSVSYCGAGLAELGRDVVQVLLRFPVDGRGVF